MIGVDLHVNHTGGYHPLVDFEQWRVAVLNGEFANSPQGIRFFERHNQTDEVFVLHKGKCLLLIAGRDDQPGQPHAVEMLPGTAYNVRKGTWHTTALTRDAVVWIVENADTSEENSSYQDLDESQQEWLKREVIAHWEA